MKIEQTRAGGEWRIRIEGRTVAHARQRADAQFLARLAHIALTNGVKGEFYPCKPEIFEATYEPAE